MYVPVFSVPTPLAVLDKETGLVWARNANINGSMDWEGALEYCANLEIAGRKGWRLPTVEELASLVDTSNEFPALPTEHPFINVRSSSYWSSNTYLSTTSRAWIVAMHNGYVSYNDKTDRSYVWPVRGGQ
jgi:hypothetical protein